MTNHEYDDILNIPRPDLRHPRMPASDRAAQFAPFAALTGYEEIIADLDRPETVPGEEAGEDIEPFSC